MRADQITVLLVDDHPLARAGARYVLQAAGVEVVAEVGTAQDALTELASRPVDVVILDISLPDESGISLLPRIRRVCPTVGVLMLSTHAEEIFAIRALRAGANGYLTKGAPSEELVLAVRQIARGGRHFSTMLGDLLVHELCSGSTHRHDVLAPREFEVMMKLVAGESNGAIAEQLHLSPKTISTHRARIFQKLGVGSVAELTRFAIEEGLLTGVVQGRPGGLPEDRRRRWTPA